jgi:predicted signal transduction protein with EAL and GGDEF domain
VLEAPFVLDGREVTVGASIGVSVREALDQAHRDLADEDALLREADTAMYAAKRTGEGPVVVFEDTLRRRAVAGSRTSRACAGPCSATSCGCTTSRSCAPTT